MEIAALTAPTSFSPGEPSGAVDLSIHAQDNNTYDKYIYPYEGDVGDVDREEEGHSDEYDQLRSTSTTSTKTVEKPTQKVV